MYTGAALGEKELCDLHLPPQPLRPQCIDVGCESYNLSGCHQHRASATGVALGDKELCDLQLPPQPFLLRGRACHSGAGLMSAYALTDLPMVLAGAPLLERTVNF